MIKSIIASAICLSLADVSCEAQLSSVPKRFRQSIIVDEQTGTSDKVRKLSSNEFGRRAYKVDKIERQLEVEGEGLSFSMRQLEEMSMSIDYSMPMSAVEAPEDEIAAASSATSAGLSFLTLVPVAWLML